MSGRFEELVARLASSESGVRRIAVHDLIGLSDARVPTILVEHVGRETDERAAVLIIRHLARAGAREAGPVLLGLYADRGTPVRIAHAAILAHDALAAE